MLGKISEAFVGWNVVHSLSSVGENTGKLCLLRHYFADVDGVGVGGFSSREVASFPFVSGEDFCLELFNICFFHC